MLVQQAGESLGDQHYNVWQLTAAFDQIRDFECRAGIVGMASAHYPVQPARLEEIASCVPYWRKLFERLELQSSLNRIDTQIRLCLRGTTNQNLATELRVLRETAQAELHALRFAFVENDKAKILDKSDKAWGDLWEKIPAIKIDVEEPVYCYALERNTACVFHLMRVAEHGLRALSKKVGVRLTQKSGKLHPVEFAEWHKVITGIKNKVEAARKLPYGAKRAQALQFYSDAADHCLYMKEIRNSISHTQNSYNALETLVVMERVRNFLVFLKAGL